MTESILNTIKQMLGIPVDNTAFDVDIIVNINSVFMVLNQLGIGPTTVYHIEDATEVWTDFLTEPATYSAIKTYIYLKVKCVFDPSASSFVLSSMENQIKELEWRLTNQVPTTP